MRLITATRAQGLTRPACTPRPCPAAPCGLPGESASGTVIRTERRGAGENAAHPRTRGGTSRARRAASAAAPRRRRRPSPLGTRAEVTSTARRRRRRRRRYYWKQPHGEMSVRGQRSGPRIT